MKLASLDLNLLLALDALLQHNSVTRAAEAMGLSQPALSASLSRLRRHFDDPLLVRVGNGSQLSPLAVQLRERVRIALASVEHAFSAEPDFSPASRVRDVSVLTSDYATEVLGGRVAAQLSSQAPRMRLRFATNVPLLVEDAERVLARNDFMVMPHGTLVDLPHVDLFRDSWVVLVAEDNTAVGERLEPRHLQELPWVATYHGAHASTPAARELRTQGLEPQVQVVVEHFLTVPALVAGSGRIGLLQRRLAARLPAGSGVRVLEPPVALSPLVEAMWWHPAFTRDVEHTWLRHLVRRAARSLDDDDGDGPAAPDGADGSDGADQGIDAADGRHQQPGMASARTS
ncbi:LysR family transcriptional regulator [Quadrisphaera setariae]|uniref:LysR family transcriptional regulator n=1 Tax=Quadrisphaera setariae TaxID=2593304 RepID=A0A5C8ZH33_9ACTN|nr:LysR family transcriptional regulator [Quadrisphaera setariae]